MMKFDGKVLIIGYGSVARCTLPILLKHVEIPYGNITIIDFENKAPALKEWTSKGIRYRHHEDNPGEHRFRPVGAPVARAGSSSTWPGTWTPAPSSNGAMSTRCCS